MAVIGTLVGSLLVGVALFIYTLSPESPCSAERGDKKEIHLLPPSIECATNANPTGEATSKSYPSGFWYGVAMLVILAPSGIYALSSLRRD
jgi:hypothetical protein